MGRLSTTECTYLPTYSEDDAMKMLSEMKNRLEFVNVKPGKLAAKPKPATNLAPNSFEEGDDPATKKRKQDPPFAVCRGGQDSGTVKVCREGGAHPMTNH